jgi:phasin
MASPKKSGGAKPAPVRSAPEPMSAVAETPPVVGSIAFEEPVAAEAAAPFAETFPVETQVAPEPVVVEPVVQPALVETVVAEMEVPVVVSLPEVNKALDAPISALTEAQDKARALAEAGIAETRAKLSQFKTAADEAASAFETSYATVKNGAIEFNTKAIEAFKATAEANFDFVKSVIGAKTPSEYVTLHSEFARKQMEALQTHTKALGELAQKIATQSVEPIKAQVAKTFNLPR